jgi:hypothetical protein
MKGLTRLIVVAVSALTLVLLAAVGAAASSGTLGSSNAVKSVITLVAPNAGLVTTAKSGSKDETKGDNNKGKHTGECHPPGLSKHHHKHGTPGHKNHPCGEDGDDSD